ncbi:hypothetical protein AAMO2058_000501400 [Amorphochlora amoebiformis]
MLRGLRDWLRAGILRKDPVAASALEMTNARTGVQEEFRQIKQDKISKSHPGFVEAMRSYESDILSALEHNQKLLANLLQPPPHPELTVSQHIEESELAQEFGITRVQYYGAKLTSKTNGYGSNDNILAHLAKDWSSLRPTEWDDAHDRIISELRFHLNQDDSPVPPDGPPSILVPGCGLGRLAYDIAGAITRKPDLSKPSPHTLPYETRLPNTNSAENGENGEKIAVTHHPEPLQEDAHQLSRGPDDGVSVYVHATETSLECLRVVDSLFNSDWKKGESSDASSQQGIQVGYIRDEWITPTRSHFTFYPSATSRKNNFSIGSRLSHGSGPIPIPYDDSTFATDPTTRTPPTSTPTTTSPPSFTQPTDSSTEQSYSSTPQLRDSSGESESKHSSSGSGQAISSDSGESIGEFLYPEISFSSMRLAEMENDADAIVTCFFFDCGDPIDTVQQINKALRPGGVWVNLGPFAYHSTGLAPTSEHLALLIEENEMEIVGNGIEIWQQDLPYFINNESTLREQVWRPAFFVARCRKPELADDLGDGILGKVAEASREYYNTA